MEAITVTILTVLSLATARNIPIHQHEAVPQLLLATDQPLSHMDTPLTGTLPARELLEEDSSLGGALAPLLPSIDDKEVGEQPDNVGELGDAAGAGDGDGHTAATAAEEAGDGETEQNATVLQDRDALGASICLPGTVRVGTECYKIHKKRS
ncbi:uncharacterized protein LOC126911135 [Spodoptera frugiperda]|uniref:Uncharacterized protein LOC126911135 n=1 Tax=Spodoptera frugiperda TaxID=7108 RepID=A0A9R0EX07_SPOFR|nr:uncharacterized protein LOC126911135 [Spodoptera frugiperda]